MAFKRSIPAPTKAQQRRQDTIREIGCIACLLGGLGFRHPEIQHLNSCGRNISQDHTIGLCDWHHRGVLPDGLVTSAATILFGPSFAKSSRQFHDRYGSDAELLEKQNMLIASYLGVAYG
jgi:hypothetical protein